MRLKFFYIFIVLCCFEAFRWWSFIRVTKWINPAICQWLRLVVHVIHVLMQHGFSWCVYNVCNTSLSFLKPVLVLTVHPFSFMIALFWISSLINYFLYTPVFFKIGPSIWHNMKEKPQSFERLACIQKYSQWHLYLSSQTPIVKCWFTVFAKFLEID